MLTRQNEIALAHRIDQELLTDDVFQFAQRAIKDGRLPGWKLDDEQKRVVEIGSIPRLSWRPETAQ